MIDVFDNPSNLIPHFNMPFRYIGQHPRICHNTYQLNWKKRSLGIITPHNGPWTSVMFQNLFFFLFRYTTNRPWTEEFRRQNQPGLHRKKVFVEPILEWVFFRGDRVYTENAILLQEELKEIFFFAGWSTCWERQGKARHCKLYYRGELIF